jgi:hypothetical protein
MYESYLKLTPKDLHLHLRKRKLHAVRIAQIEDEVARIKEIKRVDRITRTVYKRAWQDLLTPLRTELDNARVGRRYQTSTPEANALRREAFDAYIAVMEEVRSRLAWPAEMHEQMPAQWAEQLNAEKKGSPITNAGAHWTDWVPPRIKNAILEAFADLPTKPRAKRKLPFQRVIPPDQHAKQKKTLLKRTRTDHATIERKWRLNPTEENADLYINITRALEAIEQAKPNDLLPATWHGMLKL